MPEVLGREAELTALRRFVDLIPDGPRALTLEGEAGIGKTALWSAGVAYWRRAGVPAPRQPIVPVGGGALLRGPAPTRWRMCRKRRSRRSPPSSGTRSR